MPPLNETSPIIVIISIATDVEPTTYVELIASTLRRTTWFQASFGLLTGQAGGPLARYDIAQGPENEEVDLIPDLGGAYTGGSSNAGMGNISTGFPFVVEAGVRLSARVRNPQSGGRNFNLAVRLIE
jgi:hypothetical protein